MVAITSFQISFNWRLLSHITAGWDWYLKTEPFEITGVILCYGPSRHQTNVSFTSVLNIQHVNKTLEFSDTIQQNNAMTETMINMLNK